ncbi:MAG: rhomboid family intramembrane serine protease [Vicinamibacterales bacterium]
MGINDARCYSCGRANPGLWGFAPLLRKLGSDFGFAPIVIGASWVLYALTLLVSGSGVTLIGNGLNILAPSGEALYRFGSSGAYPFFVGGAWWTVLSATWLHGNLLHILFNMMWVRDLGPQVTSLLGPARTTIIYVVSGACGFLLSSFMAAYGPPIPFFSGARFVVGASASIFGLLGALVHYGRVSGSRYIHGEALRYAIILFVFGLIMSGVDNTAHAGGFIGGYLTSMVFNPLTRERGDHIAIALALLVATLLAIGASFLTSFSGLA